VTHKLSSEYSALTDNPYHETLKNYTVLICKLPPLHCGLMSILETHTHTHITSHLSVLASVYCKVFKPSNVLASVHRTQ